MLIVNVNVCFCVQVRPFFSYFLTNEVELVLIRRAFPVTFNMIPNEETMSLQVKKT